MRMKKSPRILYTYIHIYIRKEVDMCHMAECTCTHTYRYTRVQTAVKLQRDKTKILPRNSLAIVTI